MNPEPKVGDEASQPSRPTPWSGRTRGGYFGNWFFVQLIRLLGVRWAYGWLVFVAAYFTLASPRAFRCSVDYLRRVLGPRAFYVWPFLVYRHFFSFGVTLLDRFAVIMGCSRVTCRYEGEEMLREQLAQGRGILLVGAHFGNWEVGGHLLARLGKPVNLVVLEKEREQIRRLFDQALEARQFRLLTTDDHPLRSVAIVAALKRGEIVALHGDRAIGRGDVPVPFLGGIARFPAGALHLAAAGRAPIFQVFVVRERLGAYRFFSYPPQFVDKATLRQQPDAPKRYAAQYAERLAEFVRQYPFQWYNIYPFWESTNTDSDPPNAPRP